MDFELREPGSEDLPVLRNIWETVFGKEDASIFFMTYFGTGSCIAAVTKGILSASGYVFPVGDLIVGDMVLRCGMIYGVATLPGYRRHGLGAAVVRALIKKGYETGYQAIILRPSEDSLFEYYNARAGFNDWFYAKERVYCKLSTEKPGTINATDASFNIYSNTITGVDIKIDQITPDEYSSIRNSLLRGTPHLKHDMRALEYQEHLCRIYDGGFYRILTPSGTVYAIIERQKDSSVYMKELLAPGTNATLPDDTAVLSAVSTVFPMNEYIIRTPVPYNDHDIRRFGMIVSPFIDSNTKIGSMAPWFGPAFD